MCRVIFVNIRAIKLKSSNDFEPKCAKSKQNKLLSNSRFYKIKLTVSLYKNSVNFKTSRNWKKKDLISFLCWFVYCLVLVGFVEQAHR